MLESIVGVLVGLLLSALTFTNRFLYRWLDCCGPTSGNERSVVERRNTHHFFYPPQHSGEVLFGASQFLRS